MASPSLRTDIKHNARETVDGEVQQSTRTTISDGGFAPLNRTTEVSPVKYGPMTLPPTQRDNRKLFVGGLPPDVTDDEFRAFFEQFGQIVEAAVMFDRTTGRSRGFGFVAFHDTAIVAQLVEQRQLQMRDKTIEVKAAQPKASPKRQYYDAQYPSYGPTYFAPPPPPFYYEEVYCPPYNPYPMMQYCFPPSSNPASQ